MRFRALIDAAGAERDLDWISVLGVLRVQPGGRHG
jgi:hypothetical protein